MKKFLNDDQIQFYDDNGFLVVKKFLGHDAIKTLQEHTQLIVEDFDPSELKIFTTEDQENHTDTYFLESGDKVRCFFEEKAIDKNGKLKVSKKLAINKIGHAMHDLLPVFKKISYSLALFSIAKNLGLNEPSIAQSQYIFKQPNIGGKVSPHTDSTFIYTQPLSCLGAWIALEDADIHNGCLMAIPGSHKTPLQQRFIRNEKNTGTQFIELNPGYVPNTKHPEMEALPVQKGDLILLHGQLIHASYENRSQKSRHAFVLHLVDLNCNWPDDNWLQRPSAFPFKKMESVVQQLFA